MRIAMIGLRGLPANYSGVETAVEQISTRLVEQDHQVVVYCMRTADTPLPLPASYRGIDLVHIPTIPTKNLQMIVYSFLATLHALTRGYDVIHFHALGPSVMVLLCALLRQPAVATCHGLDYQREKWGFLARTYLKFGEFASGRVARELIAVSQQLKKHFFQKYGRNAHYIPNGSPSLPHVALGDFSEKYGIAEKDYFLFVGRLVECKRVNLLIEAFRQLPTEHKLVIVGAGPGNIVDALTTAAGDDPRIVLTGPLFGDDLNRIFSNAGFFVLPSVLEGLPIALIEGMSLGLPAIISDIPENVEVADDQGDIRAIVTEADNTASLKKGLALAVENWDGLIAQFADNRQFIAQKYDWTRIAAETLAVYRKAVTGS